MKDYTLHTLSNGIRVVHSRIAPSEIVHCGIMLDVGSRDETLANQGIAHFWEHMAFKGTRTRTAYHISNRLESLGGELNAFTDKEKILFYVSIRRPHLEKAIELLVDITFNAVFPEEQIQCERDIVLEEMSMYSDDPEDLLHDEFDNLVFSDHPLGRNILGTRETVQSFGVEDLRKFVKTHLNTCKTVISCVGDMSDHVVMRLAEKYLDIQPHCRSTRKRKKFTHYTPRELSIKKDIKQLKYAMGRPAYLLKDSRRTAFSILTDVLGGSEMNSRLGRVLREKHGYVYHIGAHYIPFTDTGLFMISFGTNPTRIGKSLKWIHRELDLLRETPLGPRQLGAAREQALTRLAMSAENGLSIMMSMARNLLDLGKVYTSDRICREIHEITPEKLTMLAGEMFDENQFCRLSVEPL